MKQDFFTLTYTDKVLRLAKITNKKIDSVAQAEISAGVVNNGKIARPKLFAEQISEVKNQAKPKKIIVNGVVAAVPEEKIFLKTMQIPKMPVSKIDSAIAWQIESIIPFKLKDIYFNWKIIGTTTDKIILLICVCEKAIVESLYQSLIMAKLNPLIITFPSAGLANLLAHDQTNSTVIVDLSRTNSVSLVVAKNRNVHFSTSRHIDDDFRSLDSIIHDMINYYHEKYPSQKVGNILVFGPPKLTTIENQLQQTLSQKTKVDNLEAIKIITNIKKEYISYIDNLGLDLTLDSLSLLPVEVRENYKNERINYRLGTIVNYFILFIVFLIILYGLAWGKIYYDTIKVNNQYSNLLQNEATSQQKKLESEIAKFNDKIDVIKNLNFASSIKPSFIEKITSAADENITLKEISVEVNNNVIIKGLAKGRGDLIIFQNNLNNLNIMAPINLPISALEKKENVDFELTSTKK